MLMRRLVVIVILVAATLSPAAAAPATPAAAAPAIHLSVFATGLDAPRGLTFGPDGFLYVAEAGSGGTTTTVDVCPKLQVPPPLGPLKNGPTARISRVSPAGVRSTVVDRLPSSVTQLGGDYVGVADVGFVRGRLYAVIAGGGCSNGERNPNRPNGVIRVKRDGSWSYVANLSAYYMAHPVAHPEPGDFTPDGVPYSMVTKGRALYIIEANQGAVDRVSTRSGRISRVLDISASQGHIVPTAIDRRGRRLYISSLGRFPITAGAQHVYRITRHGKLKQVASGLTAVVGIAFDHNQRLYALETSRAGQFPQPSSGRVVRLSHSGRWETIVAALNFPTAMTFGPDGALYISTNGYNLAAGRGRIVRVAIADHEDNH